MYSGLVRTAAQGPFGWAIAFAMGLPANGQRPAGLETAETSRGLRFTRRFGSKERTSYFTKTNEHTVEQLGPLRLWFRDTVVGQCTDQELTHFGMGPVRIPAGSLVRVTSHSIEDDTSLESTVTAVIASRRIASLEYRVQLTTPSVNTPETQKELP